MSAAQGYPYPQVFLVENGGGQQPSDHPPGLVPCWSFPPAQQMVRERARTRGCSSWSLGLALLFLLLLVFGALGLGAYQIHKLQTQLDRMQQDPGSENKVHRSEKLISDFPGTSPETDSDREKPASRPAAHVIGRINTGVSQKTLRWESKAGRAFSQGGVVYWDGGLQVNETGLYHIYTRVQFDASRCTPTDSLVHAVFVRRQGNPKPLTLMEGRREGYCSTAISRSVWTSESYLGSTLQLETKDWVYVNVSHPDLLTHSHHANFFGLHKV
ncbi:hypothetical protein DPEC_G00341350 [Dallia pectoralis]|uniref:Uncharacterized protein n=1 Tax=Dallia pectoralis TaxID=75939 RepID=A0ACC2F5E9_DALPE|nr:hypothetical protein DPEC_G00341350 [Dallia pectoralis]